MDPSPHRPRILVIRGGAIGDFIMTLPAIGALRDNWPDAHIEILGYPHITELAHERYYANATRSVESQPMAGFFVPQGVLDPVWMDYFGGFDLIVSFLYDPDRIFADNLRRCEAGQVIEASSRSSELPAAQHLCRALEALAIYVNAPHPRIYPNEKDRAFAAGFFRDFGRERVVAVHPGSGSTKKNWPVTNFSALCQWLIDEMAVQLLVIHGEADDMPIQELTKLLAHRSARFARGLKLVELAAVLERCSLFLGNDSGITHLAAAVNTPTVAMFGPSSMPIWEPVGDKVRVVKFGPGDVENARRAMVQLWD